MPYLFFDTETTGFPRHNVEPGHPTQPHLVQLAALLTDDGGAERASLSLIVNSGVAIPVEAANVHGITEKVAAQFGVPLKSALRVFYSMARHAHTYVAHNIRFDMAIMATASQRIYGMTPPPVQQFCTMDAATPILNLPPTARMSGAGYGSKPKPPKLEECVRHFFGEALDGAHDAMVDVRACARVFFHMRSLAKPDTAPSGAEGAR